MAEYHMAKRVLMAEESGGRERKKVEGNRGMTVKHCAKDRKEWRALVHM